MDSIRFSVTNVKRFAMIIMLALVCSAITSCKPGDYNVNTSLNVRDAAPEEKARAELLYAQAEAERMQTEQDRQRAQIETDIIADTAKVNQQLSIEQRRAEIQSNVQKANTETAVIQARGQAEIRAVDTKSRTAAQVDLANAAAWSNFISMAGNGIIIITLGFAGALAITSLGYSAAYAKRAWAQADYLLIQAANRDLPPLIITRSGYLLDPLTGERAKLSDPAGVNQLRTLAMTRLLEASALAHSAASIGRDNRRRLSGGVQAADVMPGIAASIPCVLPIDGGNDE